MKRFCYFLLFLISGIFLSFSVSAQQENQANIFSNNLILKDIFNQEKGFGPSQTFAFGTVQAVSCRQTINHQTKILTALQVSLNPDWILKKPIIPSSDSPLWTKEQIFYPFSTVDSYQNTIFFPIIYTLTNPSQPFSVQKEVPLTACLNENCQTQSALFSLNLEASSGYTTNVCPAVMDALAASPHPINENIIVSARVNSNNHIQVVIDFPQKPKLAEGYFPKEIEYTLQKKSINGFRAEFVFLLKQKIKEGIVLPFIVVSSLGTFEINLYPRKLPFLFVNQPFEYPSFFGGGLLFLFFSAFYLLFWSIRPDNQATLDKIGKKVYRWAFIFPFVIALCLFFGLPIGRILNHPIVLFFQIVLLIGLLIKPYINERLLPILLALMPYLFLSDYFLSVPSFRFSVFRVAAGWSVCCILPFWFTRRLPNLFRSFSTAHRPIRLLIRLPLIISLAGVGLTLFLPDVAAPYSKEALQAALNENQAVYVTVENNACFTCRLNHFYARFFELPGYFYHRGNLKLMRVSQQSKSGKELLANYGLSPTGSFGLLFGPDNKNGLFIQNKYLQTNEWKEIFEQVGVERPKFEYSIAE